MSSFLSLPWFALPSRFLVSTSPLRNYPLKHLGAIRCPHLISPRWQFDGSFINVLNKIGRLSIMYKMPKSPYLQFEKVLRCKIMELVFVWVVPKQLTFWWRKAYSSMVLQHLRYLYCSQLQGQNCARFKSLWELIHRMRGLSKIWIHSMI